MQKIDIAADELGIKTMESNLKKEYKAALKDEKFKTLVDMLKIDESMLMKYTSLLEESACEYDNCMHCKNLFECKNKVKGYAYLPKLEGRRIAFNYRACKYEEKRLKANEFKKNITLYQTPEGMLDARMSDIYLKDAARFPAIEYLTKFIENYPNVEKGLYITTIPYDESWHLKINGKEIKKIKVLDSLIGFEAEEGILEIEFVPQGLLLGVIISGTAFLTIFVYYARKRLM